MRDKEKLNLESAVKAVNERSLLLVFAAKNRSEIPSLWSYFYPRSEMKWEWDEDGDQRVADLWHLRERISSSRKIIYAKWFQGRATLISKKVFPALLRSLNSFDGSQLNQSRLSSAARELLQVLMEDSPLSTKQLKAAVGLKGRSQESTYSRSLGELWKRLLIVGCGEVDEGAFPSLAMASTKVWFENDWDKALGLSHEEAFHNCQKSFGETPFWKFYERQLKELKVSKAKKDIQPKLKKSWIGPEDL